MNCTDRKMLHCHWKIVCTILITKGHLILNCQSWQWSVKKHTKSTGKKRLITSHMIDISKKYWWMKTFEYYRRKSQIRPIYLRLDQPVQEPPAIGSRICLSSDCHCSSHICSNLWNIFMKWQSETWQLWLLRADIPCTDWSNLRHTGRIYDFRL